MIISLTRFLSSPDFGKYKSKEFRLNAVRTLHNEGFHVELEDKRAHQNESMEKKNRELHRFQRCVVTDMDTAIRNEPKPSRM